MRSCILTGMLLLALAACKKVSTDCDYIVEPRLQAEEKGIFRADTNVIAFVFYADTLAYRPGSYETAQQGRLVSATEPSATLERSVESSWDEERGVLVLAGLKRSPVVVVACDTVRRLYAWKQGVIPEDLARIVTPVNFLPWQFAGTEDRAPAAYYKNAGWTVCSAERDAALAPASGASEND